VPTIYADTSALVKLVRIEPHSKAVREYLDGADLVSSELILAEVPRAMRRIAFEGSPLPLVQLLERGDEVLETVTMAPVEPLLLEAAGEIAEPGLRALDAVHVITAMYLTPIDAFLTYDVRQAASARLAGLRTVAPGRVS
jgi:uncharacterized protein